MADDADDLIENSDADQRALTLARRSASNRRGLLPKGNPPCALSSSPLLRLALVAAPAPPPRRRPSPRRSPRRPAVRTTSSWRGRKPARSPVPRAEAGMHVLDLFGANAYWAEIMSPVVGPRATLRCGSRRNSTATSQTSSGFRGQAPQRLDRHVAVRSAGPAEELRRFRDPQRQLSRHLLAERKYEIPQMDPNAFLKAVYAAMKPGAVIGVIDHVASPNNDTRATVEKYPPHRSQRGQGGFQTRGLRVRRKQQRPAQPCRRPRLLGVRPKDRGQHRPVRLQVQEAALSAPDAGPRGERERPPRILGRSPRWSSDCRSERSPAG